MRVLSYVHPAAGVLVLLLLAYVGLLGLQTRTRRRERAALLARHSRLAPVAYGLALASWIGGFASVLWLRPDLSIASSLHFRIGTSMVILLTGNALTARLMTRGNRAARELHPWLGAAAVLLAAAHAATGLRIMP